MYASHSLGATISSEAGTTSVGPTTTECSPTRKLVREQTSANVRFSQLKEYLHPEDSGVVCDTLEKHASYRTRIHWGFCVWVTITSYVSGASWIGKLVVKDYADNQRRVHTYTTHKCNTIASMHTSAVDSDDWEVEMSSGGKIWGKEVTHIWSRPGQYPLSTPCKGDWTSQPQGSSSLEWWFHIEEQLWYSYTPIVIVYAQPRGSHRLCLVSESFSERHAQSPIVWLRNNVTALHRLTSVSLKLTLLPTIVTLPLSIDCVGW